MRVYDPAADLKSSKTGLKVKRVNPTVPVLQLSTRTGQGMSDWCEWLRWQSAAAREAAFT
jgi:Ni2+-binding GTPase involved in maturation of urease and hydrogenase